MLFKRITRDLPEQVFTVFQNNEGSTMAKDATCQMDLTTDVDGVKARYIDDGQQYAFLGIVDAAVATGQWGLAQVYGYRSSSNVLRTDTNLSAGMPLIVATAAQHLAQVGTAIALITATVGPASWVFAAESSTSGAGSSTPKIFIRAMSLAGLAIGIARVIS